MLLGESALSNDKIRTVRPRERARGTFELPRKRVRAHSCPPGKSAFLKVPAVIGTETTVIGTDLSTTP